VKSLQAISNKRSIYRKNKPNSAILKILIIANLANDIPFDYFKINLVPSLSLSTNSINVNYGLRQIITKIRNARTSLLAVSPYLSYQLLLPFFLFLSPFFYLRTALLLSLKNPISSLAVTGEKTEKSALTPFTPTMISVIIIVLIIKIQS